MAGRRLSPEEQAIWSQVTQSVRPLPGRRKRVAAPKPEPETAAVPAPVVAMPRKAKKASRAMPVVAVPAPAPPSARGPVDYLDHGWERRIATGALMPEMTVDLHGHTLDAAHRRLGQSLAQARAQGVRVLLVITGRPRPAAIEAAGQRNRGAIRAEIGDWLALGGHADAIASVRTAHPRHGGHGALYIILRRER